MYYWSSTESQYISRLATISLHSHLDKREATTKMAICPKVAFAQASPSNSTFPEPINIDAWTEQATQSLNAASLTNSKGVHSTLALAIDLDEQTGPKQDERMDEARPVYRPRREPLRRDSLKRREALLKGNEGSRRRTRWENGSYHYQ